MSALSRLTSLDAIDPLCYMPAPAEPEVTGYEMAGGPEPKDAGRISPGASEARAWLLRGGEAESEREDALCERIAAALNAEKRERDLRTGIAPSVTISQHISSIGAMPAYASEMAFPLTRLLRNT